MDSTQPAIEVTSIRPDSVMLPGQSPVEGYRVEFTTPSGIHSYIKVERTDDLQRVVQDAVEAEAARLEDVVALYPKRTPINIRQR